MVDEPLKYTQYDTDPPLEADLEQQDPDTGAWGPMDLEGKTVRLLAEHRKTKRRFGGPVVVVSLPGPDAPTRRRYVLQPDDLAEPGTYSYQWEVTAPDGTIRTVPPGDAWFELEVAHKLGAPLVAPVAGVDSTGPWIDGAVVSSAAGVDGTGAWIDGAAVSALVGVDGTGPWIEAG